MTSTILESEAIKGIIELTYEMWKKGWDESNGGNISYLLSDEEVSYLQPWFDRDEEVEINNLPTSLLGRYVAITAAGSQFRTLKEDPEVNIGIIQITNIGYRIVWGFKNNRKATSELYMHLLSHEARLEVDSNQRVVVHNHASYATAYSLISEPDDKAYTLPLWQVLTESIVVFPDGVGVLPWQLPGTEEIGVETAKKLKDSRIVVWTFHGILATGAGFQDCFGLIETVDKAAKIYLETLEIKKFNGLTEDNLKEVCAHMGVTPNPKILS